MLPSTGSWMHLCPQHSDIWRETMGLDYCGRSSFGTAAILCKQLLHSDPDAGVSAIIIVFDQAVWQERIDRQIREEDEERRRPYDADDAYERLCDEKNAMYGLL